MEKAKKINAPCMHAHEAVCVYLKKIMVYYCKIEWFFSTFFLREQFSQILEKTIIMDVLRGMDAIAKSCTMEDNFFVNAFYLLFL